MGCKHILDVQYICHSDLFHILIYYQPTRIVIPDVAKPEYGKHGFLYTSSLAVHYVACGTPGKPLILFVHGFPEV